MKYRISSDWHKTPGDRLTDAEISFLDCPPDTMGIINGDLINLLPYGKKAWDTIDGRLTISDFANYVPSQGCIITTGNHEGRYSWLKELFKPYPQVIVTDYLDIGNWRIEHGHKFSEWRILSWGADDVVNYLTSSNSWLRKLWYNFCKDRGWMPSAHANPGTKYGEIVGFYWGNIIREATKRNRNYIVGHSHKAHDFGEIDFGSSKVHIIDLGTMTKGDYWEGEL